MSWSLIEPEWTAAAKECYGRLACGDSDDECSDEGFAAIGITDEAEVRSNPLFQACEPRARVCGFSTDRCVTLLLLTATGRGRANACLDMACSSVNSCLTDLLGV